MIGELANHLWQSTLFAVAVGLLTLAFRKNRAHVRYWLWLSASFKFLVPFALLMSLGSRLNWAPPANNIAKPAVTIAMQQISQPFPDVLPLAPSTQANRDWIPTALFAVWACGFGAIALIRFRGWLRIRAAVRASNPIDIPATVEVRSTPGLLEPGVVGLLRPILLLPAGIAERLTPPQLEAVLAHELCHVRRHDNLTAAVHMVVEAVFWFHPLVWWIGTWLVDEREKACDEAVLSLGGDPRDYAEAILNVCKLYAESPLVCASGVTGSNLKRRIEAIMTNRTSQGLTPARKLALGAACLTAFAVPIGIGVVNAPRIRAQSDLKFEVASIKPADPATQGSHSRRLPGGGLDVRNGTVKSLLTLAYNVLPFQISGGPGWIGYQKFDIVAKPERFEGPQDFKQMTDEQQRTSTDRLRQRVRALLVDRFHLAIHQETKDGPIYTLVVARSGSKLAVSASANSGTNTSVSNGRGTITGEAATMEMLAKALASVTGRTVRDRTGLTGKFDFKMEWTQDRGPGFPLGEAANPPDTSAASLFTAIQEQLGLRLESTRGPIDMIVIDRVEKPSSN